MPTTPESTLAQSPANSTVHPDGITDSAAEGNKTAANLRVELPVAMPPRPADSSGGSEIVASSPQGDGTRAYFDTPLQNKGVVNRHGLPIFSGNRLVISSDSTGASKQIQILDVNSTQATVPPGTLIARAAGKPVIGGIDSLTAPRQGGVIGNTETLVPRMTLRHIEGNRWQVTDHRSGITTTSNLDIQVHTVDKSGDVEIVIDNVTNTDKPTRLGEYDIKDPESNLQRIVQPKVHASGAETRIDGIVVQNGTNKGVLLDYGDKGELSQIFISDGTSEKEYKHVDGDLFAQLVNGEPSTDPSDAIRVNADHTQGVSITYSEGRKVTYRLDGTIVYNDVHVSTQPSHLPGITVSGMASAQDSTTIPRQSYLLHIGGGDPSKAADVSVTKDANNDATKLVTSIDGKTTRDIVLQYGNDKALHAVTINGLKYEKLPDGKWGLWYRRKGGVTGAVLKPWGGNVEVDQSKGLLTITQPGKEKDIFGFDGSESFETPDGYKHVISPEGIITYLRSGSLSGVGLGIRSTNPNARIELTQNTLPDGQPQTEVKLSNVKHVFGGAKWDLVQTWSSNPGKGNSWTLTSPSGKVTATDGTIDLIPFKGILNPTGASKGTLSMSAQDRVRMKYTVNLGIASRTEAQAIVTPPSDTTAPPSSSAPGKGDTAVPAPPSASSDVLPQVQVEPPALTLQERTARIQGVQNLATRLFHSGDASKRTVGDEMLKLTDSALRGDNKAFDKVSQIYALLNKDTAGTARAAAEGAGIAEDAAREAGKAGGKVLGVGGMVIGPLIAGGAALVGGASIAEAATAAADTVLPASAVEHVRYAEAALEAPKIVAEYAIPIPGLGQAVGNALTDIPRAMLRASGYNVDPALSEQYHERLKTEYSVAEVRDELLKPGSAIYQQVASGFGAQYDQMIKTAQQTGGGLPPSMPSRATFIKAQIAAALKPILTPSATMSLVPSGISR